MAAIIHRVTKGPDESVPDFKERVSAEYLAICDELYPKCTLGMDGYVLSRITEEPANVLNVQYAFRWGQAFTDLPSETCCIAWLSPSECRDKLAIHDPQGWYPGR